MILDPRTKLLILSITSISVFLNKSIRGHDVGGVPGPAQPDLHDGHVDILMTL